MGRRLRRANESSGAKTPRRNRLWRAFVFKLGNHGCDGYDASFPVSKVLAPTFWLYLVWGLMMLTLWVVGYLEPDKAPNVNDELIAALDSTKVDVAARRAALALSGVTLAITIALATTSLFWCLMSWWGKSGAYRSAVLVIVAISLLLSLLISWHAASEWSPFTSEIGEELLSRGAIGLDAPVAQYVPLLMFLLSCAVPGVLLAGSTFLLQPMRWTANRDRLSIQVMTLLKRMRELDQMLYIGALALVFGTLQLSAGLSVMLASMPKGADLKVRADLCKAVSPTPVASSALTADPPARSGPAQRPSAIEAHCQEVPGLITKLESTESLRQLVRGITICFGLAFSALLAAIYTPAFIVLRSMLEARQQAFSAAEPSKEGAAPFAPSPADPMAKIAAVVATLSPLFAGLLANSLGA